MTRVRVTVPATSSHLGPGLDSMALALQLHNVVELGEAEQGLIVTIRGEGADRLARDAGNLVVKGAVAVFRRVGCAPGGLRVHLEYDIPPELGLGSSAAAVLGGVVAANVLIGSPLARDEVLRTAASLDGRVAAVAAALFGGLVVTSRHHDDLFYSNVPIAGMFVGVVAPLIESPARHPSLPQHVSLSDAVHNIGRAALVVQALNRGDYALLERAMRDRLHEPVRSKLIPGYRRAVAAARRNGAAAVAISSSGPALIAFAQDNHEEIVDAMARAMRDEGAPAVLTWVLPVDTQGISISESGVSMSRNGSQPTPASLRRAPLPIIGGVHRGESE